MFKTGCFQRVLHHSLMFTPQSWLKLGTKRTMTQSVSDLHHHKLLFSLESADFLDLMSVIVSLLKHSPEQRSQSSFFLPDGKSVTVYHYGSLSALSNRCSQVGCKPPCGCGDASACCAAPGCRGIFIIFKEAASSWVVLAMCQPRVWVNMCLCECACVMQFGPCCLHILWISFAHVALQASIFAQNCTSHRLPFHLIIHGSNLQRW